MTIRFSTRIALVAAVLATVGCTGGCLFVGGVKTRSISVAEYRDKMAGAWIGQSVGVAYGWPTEFRKNGELFDWDKLPVWKPELINETFSQDDLYVEMTFINTLDTRGVDVGVVFCRRGQIRRVSAGKANQNGQKNDQNGKKFFPHRNIGTEGTV